MMNKEVLSYDIDHLETLGRKDGILFTQKAFHRKRDLVLTLISSLDRSVVLISAGRHISKLEQIHHPNLKSIIRINEKEPSGLLSWSDDLNLFNYVTPSMEKALSLSMELAQRGDMVLFSPFGTKEEVTEWMKLIKRNVSKIGLII